MGRELENGIVLVSFCVFNLGGFCCLRALSLVQFACISKAHCFGRFRVCAEAMMMTYDGSLSLSPCDGRYGSVVG